MSEATSLESRWTRAARWLSHARLPWFAALLAIALSSPSLSAGFEFEDAAHRAGSQRSGAWFGGFFGAPGHRPAIIAGNYAAKDDGRLPWIASQELNLALFRPLTAFTHHVDYRLWPEHPALMHLHTLLWLGVLVFAAAKLYARLLPPAVAGLAALLYAIDDSRGMAVGWLANRSAILASALGVVALVLHDRWARDRWRPGALLGGVTFGCALLGGEYAVGALGLFMAHALLIDRSPLGRRLLHTLPWLLAFALWALAYRAGGWGAVGSGAYLDPLRTPLLFARGVVDRLPFLLYGIFGLRPPELLTLLAVQSFGLYAGVALLVLGLLAVVPLAVRDRRAGALALACLFALIPTCAGLPSDRMLVLAMVPGLGVVAAGLHAVFARRSEIWRSRPARGVALGAATIWILGHGIAAPILSPKRSLGLAAPAGKASELASDAFRDCTPDEELTLIDAPDLYTGSQLIAAHLGMRQQAGPLYTRVLHGGRDRVLVTRVDDRTLLVRPELGFLHSLNVTYRGAADPLRVGWGIQLSRLLIKVTEVDERGTPMEVSFRYSWPLDDPHYRFLAMRGDHYVPFPVPAIGESVSWDPE